MGGVTSKKILVCILLVLALCGCKKTNKFYQAPLKYTAETVMTVNADNQDKEYMMNIACDINKYKITVKNNLINYGILYDEETCTLINDNFKENQVVLNNPTIIDSMLYEINLNKFTGMECDESNTITLNDGSFKNILVYDQKTFKPVKISVFRDDELVKTVEYNNVELYNNNSNFKVFE